MLDRLGAADSMACAGNVADLAIPITLDGGAGEETLLGDNGNDILIGGDDDLIDGNQGHDVALMGEGNDTFNRDPGYGTHRIIRSVASPTTQC